MPSYRFMLSNTDEVREAGVVQSETFAAALRAINSQFAANEGDTLEIGVQGFPPARFECIWSGEIGGASWRPARLAA
jgi:hypothetical protein